MLACFDVQDSNGHDYGMSTDGCAPVARLRDMAVDQPLPPDSASLQPGYTAKKLTHHIAQSQVPNGVQGCGVGQVILQRPDYARNFAV